MQWPFDVPVSKVFLVHGPETKTSNSFLSSPKARRAKLVESPNCNMLIYNVGGALPSLAKPLLISMRCIRCARTLRWRSSPMMRATSVSSPRSIAALKAYVSNSMSPDLVLEALSFVLHGGTYFPPMGILANLESGGSGKMKLRSQGKEAQLKPDARRALQ